MNSPTCPIQKLEAFTDAALTSAWADVQVLSWDDTTQTGIFNTRELYTKTIVYIQITNLGGFTSSIAIPIEVAENNVCTGATITPISTEDIAIALTL
jgi:hypothetical protein